LLADGQAILHHPCYSRTKGVFHRTSPGAFRFLSGGGEWRFLVVGFLEISFFTQSPPGLFIDPFAVHVRQPESDLAYRWVED